MAASRLTRGQQAEQHKFLSSLGPEARAEARKLYDHPSPALATRLSLTTCRPFPNSPINAGAPLCEALRAQALAKLATPK